MPTDPCDFHANDVAHKESDRLRANEEYAIADDLDRLVRLESQIIDMNFQSRAFGDSLHDLLIPTRVLKGTPRTEDDLLKAVERLVANFAAEKMRTTELNEENQALQIDNNDQNLANIKIDEKREELERKILEQQPRIKDLKILIDLVVSLTDLILTETADDEPPKSDWRAIYERAHTVFKRYQELKKAEKEKC